MQDLPFSILFLFTILAVAFTVFMLPTPAGQHPIAPSDETDKNSWLAVSVVPLAIALATASAGSVSFCFVWLALQQSCPTYLMIAALVIPVSVSTSITAGCAFRLMFAVIDANETNMYLMIGGVGLLFTIFNSFWLHGLWHKIPVSALALAASSRVVYHLPGLMAIAAFSVVFQVPWAAMCGLGAYRILLAFDGSEDLGNTQ